MQKSSVFSVLWVVSSSLAGCQKSDAAPSSGASAQATPGTAAAAVTSAAAKSGPSPCSLLTKAEVEATLHDTFEEPAESPRTANTCEYKHKGSHFPFIAITVYPFQTRSTFESETETAAKVIKGTRTPVAGVGEEAFVVADAVFSVYAKGKSFGITYLSKPLEPSQRDALARIVLGRM